MPLTKQHGMTCNCLCFLFVFIPTLDIVLWQSLYIVLSESADSIIEATSVLRQWNPEWCPEFFTADFSEAEIQTLESSFPNSFVYLFDLHREQAWVRNKKHELSTVEAEIAFMHVPGLH